MTFIYIFTDAEIITQAILLKPLLDYSEYTDITNFDKSKGINI